MELLTPYIVVDVFGSVVHLAAAIYCRFGIFWIATRSRAPLQLWYVPVPL